MKIGPGKLGLILLNPNHLKGWAGSAAGWVQELTVGGVSERDQLTNEQLYLLGGDTPPETRPTMKGATMAVSKDAYDPNSEPNGWLKRVEEAFGQCRYLFFRALSKRADMKLPDPVHVLVLQFITSVEQEYPANKPVGPLVQGILKHGDPIYFAYATFFQKLIMDLPPHIVYEILIRAVNEARSMVRVYATAAYDVSKGLGEILEYQVPVPLNACRLPVTPHATELRGAVPENMVPISQFNDRAVRNVVPVHEATYTGAFIMYNQSWVQGAALNPMALGKPIPYMAERTAAAVLGIAPMPLVPGGADPILKAQMNTWDQNEAASIEARMARRTQ